MSKNKALSKYVSQTLGHKVKVSNKDDGYCIKWNSKHGSKHKICTDSLSIEVYDYAKKAIVAIDESEDGNFPPYQSQDCDCNSDTTPLEIICELDNLINMVMSDKEPNLTRLKILVEIRAIYTSSER